MWIIPTCKNFIYEISLEKIVTKIEAKGLATRGQERGQGKGDRTSRMLKLREAWKKVFRVDI